MLHPDDDRRETVCEDLLADVAAEHGVADHAPTSASNRRSSSSRLSGDEYCQRYAGEIVQRLVFGVSRVERDLVIGQERTIGIGQPPAPMVGVGKSTTSSRRACALIASFPPRRLIVGPQRGVGTATIICAVTVRGK